MAASVWGMHELKVLGFITRSPARKTRYSVAIELNLPIPTVYKVFSRFEADGLVMREIERVDPRLSSREPRALFRATTCANDAINAIREAVC